MNLSEKIDRILGNIKPVPGCDLSKNNIPKNIRYALSYVAYKKQIVPAVFVDGGGAYQPFKIGRKEIYHTFLTAQAEVLEIEKFDEGLLVSSISAPLIKWQQIYHNRSERDGDIMQVRISAGESSNKFTCIVWAWKGFAHYPELLEKMLKGDNI